MGTVDLQPRCHGIAAIETAISLTRISETPLCCKSLRSTQILTVCSRKVYIGSVVAELTPSLQIKATKNCALTTDLEKRVNEAERNLAEKVSCDWMLTRLTVDLHKLQATSQCRCICIRLHW